MLPKYRRKLWGKTLSSTVTWSLELKVRVAEWRKIMFYSMYLFNVLIVFVWMNSTHKIGSYFYWKCASYLYILSIDLATCYCLTSSQICSGSQQKNDTIMTSFSTSASISPLYSLSVPLLPCFTQTFTVLLEWISFSFPVLFAHFFFLIATHIFFFFLCLWEHKTLWIQSSLSGQLSSFAMCCLRCRSLKKYIYLFIYFSSEE